MKKTALILTFALAALPMAFGAQRAERGAGGMHRQVGRAYGRAGSVSGGRYRAIGGANRCKSIGRAGLNSTVGPAF